MVALGFHIVNFIIHTAALGLFIWQFITTRSKIYRTLTSATASLFVADILLFIYSPSSLLAVIFLYAIITILLYLALLFYALLPVQLLQLWLHAIANSSMDFKKRINVLYIIHPAVFFVAVLLLIVSLAAGLVSSIYLGLMYTIGAIYLLACLFAAYMVWMCNRDHAINSAQQGQLGRMAGMMLAIAPTLVASLSDAGMYVLFVLTWIYLAIALWPLKYWATMDDELLSRSEQRGRVGQGPLPPDHDPFPTLSAVN
jgi:hypothetical protein